ncbi:hypothetical protein J3R30DRAFT_3456082 [Lentinula aciculospora]|uniref:G-patch domain-containing protein n=1 Tax=Lentinula aciculospora TaxID=153920 RepID=A0A9W9DSD2_9AGAR|nr:hypothetical protein J3R30DRAFT_3456082 [Lentinula aciculospora]
MATTAYTIYSHYDPADREQLERETGQLTETSDDAWQTEAVKAFKRKQAPPPRFVPAFSTSGLSVDNWSTPGAGSSKLPSASSSSNEVSGWYRSVMSSRGVDVENTKPTPSPFPGSTSSQSNTTTHNKPTKNDWFIQRVLASETPSQASRISPPSLADMIARNPLPAPNEQPFKPPVFLAIGPSNKGFTMLQNNGWNEGEALGQDVVRRRRIQRDDPSPWVKEEIVEVQLGDGEITEIKKISVVDLTASDSESESEPEDHGGVNNPVGILGGRKALLTPLPTVLKSDRLGIGLKAKIEGPYKSSLKRVTHNAEALVAHQRRAEEAQARKEKWGRGQRGFARRDKDEQIRRQNMIAYMNS